MMHSLFFVPLSLSPSLLFSGLTFLNSLFLSFFSVLNYMENCDETVHARMYTVRKADNTDSDSDCYGQALPITTGAKVCQSMNSVTFKNKSMKKRVTICGIDTCGSLHTYFSLSPKILFLMYRLCSNIPFARPHTGQKHLCLLTVSQWGTCLEIESVLVVCI